MEQVWHHLPFLVALVGLLVALGFGTGWLLPRVLGSPRGDQIATLFAVGIRNNSTGLVVALGHFPPLAVVPMLISMFLQQPLAALCQRHLTRGAAAPPP
jgi:bile acid:Na+ symporter, BASS family